MFKYCDYLHLIRPPFIPVSAISRAQLRALGRFLEVGRLSMRLAAKRPQIFRASRQLEPPKNMIVHGKYGGVNQARSL